MIPQIGEHYRHYKSKGGDDKTYKVIGLGKHSETEELLVIYKPLYSSISLLGGAEYWIRPLSMRYDIVECNGVETKRFIKI